MEWIVMGVVGLGAVGWWLARAPVVPTPPAEAAAGMSPLAAEVARRVADPNDPDGAFMDGYVAGRYTERYLDRSGSTDRSSSSHNDGDSRGFRSDDFADEDSAAQVSDDDIWADPHDSFDDDSSDDW